MSTIFDVAGAAGVSHQTVSRVVNGDPSVRPATRARVEEAIAALGYRRNAAARALASGRTRTIGLLATGLPLYGPSSTTHSFNHAARTGGWDVAIAATDGSSGDAVRHAADTLLAQDVAALVVLAPTPSVLEALDSVRIPVPLVVTERTGLARASSVSIDSAAGAALAVEHLAALGHREVLHLAGPADWIESADRERGWRDACARFGVTAPEPVRGDWTAATASALAAGIARGGAPTAVFAANDQSALGLLAGFAAAGLTVPDDVSIVGFDDIPECAYFAPPLTTVRQDFGRLGALLVDAVDRLVDGEPAPEVRLVPELVVRVSTAPAPGYSDSAAARSAGSPAS